MRGPRTRLRPVRFRAAIRWHRKVETILANAHVHTIRITHARQLDAQMAKWLKEAYHVGCQEHLRRPGSDSL